MNGDNFVTYINKLADKMDYAPFSLFMDNLQVHRMNIVRDACEDNRITRVWNISHSP